MSDDQSYTQEIVSSCEVNHEKECEKELFKQLTNPNSNIRKYCASINITEYNLTKDKLPGVQIIKIKQKK